METNNGDIIAQLTRIGELLHRYNHRHHRMHGPAGDRTRGQGRVMALLKMRPEISQKELSYLLDIRPQSLGELLGKLERAGYIERAPSEADRRVMEVKLTKEGMDAAEKKCEGENPIKRLGEEEQKILSEHLDKIIADLEEELKDFQAENGCCGERHWRPEMERGECRKPGPGHEDGCEKGYGYRHGRGCEQEGGNSHAHDCGQGDGYRHGPGPGREQGYGHRHGRGRGREQGDGNGHEHGCPDGGRMHGEMSRFTEK